MKARKNNKLRPKISLQAGAQYQVRGYHTGDFTGECISVSRIFAVFRVTGFPYGKKTSPLNIGDQIEVAVTLLSISQEDDRAFYATGAITITTLDGQPL